MQTNSSSVDVEDNIELYKEIDSVLQELEDHNEIDANKSSYPSNLDEAITIALEKFYLQDFTDSSTKPSYPTIPDVRVSFDKVANSLLAYNLSGTNGLITYGVSQYFDDLLKANGAVQNYASKAVMWGSIGYKTVKYVLGAKTLSSPIKPPLIAAVVISSSAMIYYGKDIFDRGFVLEEGVRSALTAARMFSRDMHNENNIFAQIANKYEASTIEAITLCYQHREEIIANDFIRNLMKKNAMQLTTTFARGVIIEKLLLADQYIPPEIYYTNIKFALASFARNILSQLIVHFSGSLSQKADNKLNFQLKEKIATYIIGTKEIDLQQIIHLEQELKQLPQRIETIRTEAEQNFNKIIENLTTLILDANSGNSKGKIFAEVMENSPLHLFVNLITNNLITHNNIKYIFDRLFTQSIEDLNNENRKIGIESQDIKNAFSGNSNIGRLLIEKNIETFSYQSLQEVYKLGANSFILSQIIKFYQHQSEKEYKYNSVGIFQSSTSALLPELINLVFMRMMNLSYQGLLKSGFNINIVTELIGANCGSENTSWLLYNNQSKTDITELLNKLGSKYVDNATKVYDDSNSLRIINYALSVGDGEANRVLLEIPNLEFNFGKIYVIDGQNGRGKTTLLTDIGNFLNRAFQSQGEIRIPKVGSEPIKVVYTGDQAFSPPATTFFEKLTYRLPEEYVANHKDLLSEKILDIFSLLGQTQFTNKILEMWESEAKLNLSAGQQKMALLIPIFLYKEYINGPVILIIDETFNSINHKTIKQLSEMVKKYFSESIILAVDHEHEAHSFFGYEKVCLDDFAPNVVAEDSGHQLVDLIGAP